MKKELFTKIIFLILALFSSVITQAQEKENRFSYDVTVGPITLGAGTVAGVIGGKVVGAWAGSAAAATAIAIYDAWSDFFN